MREVDCNLCGSRTRTLLYDIPDPVDARSSWRLWRCAECSLVYLNPQPDPDDLAPHYGREYYGEQNVRFGGPLEAFEIWCRRQRARRVGRLRSPGRVLDVGCGRGVMLAALRDMGWQVVGTEVSAEAARHARDHLGIEVHAVDLTDLPHQHSHFDAITFWHVLEHLPDAGGAIRRARALLRPGGLLVVAVPNMDSLEACLAGPAWFHLDVPRHLFDFPESALWQLLDEQGFLIRRVRRLSLEFGPFGMAQSLLNRLGFQHNLLYDALRTRGARTPSGVTGARRAVQLMAHVVLLPFVGPVAGLLHLLDGILGRGSCLEVYADRRT